MTRRSSLAVIAIALALAACPPSTPRTDAGPADDDAGIVGGEGEGEGNVAGEGEGEGEGVVGEGEGVAGEGEGEGVAGEGEGEGQAAGTLTIAQVDVAHVDIAWSVADVDACHLTFDAIEIDDGGAHIVTRHLHAAPPQGATITGTLTCTSSSSPSSSPITLTSVVVLPKVPHIETAFSDRTLRFDPTGASTTQFCWTATDADECGASSDLVGNGQGTFGCIPARSAGFVTCSNALQTATASDETGVSTSHLPASGGDVDFTWDMQAFTNPATTCALKVNEDTSPTPIAIAKAGTMPFHFTDPSMIRLTCGCDFQSMSPDCFDSITTVDVGPKIRGVGVRNGNASWQTSGYESCDLVMPLAKHSLFDMPPNASFTFGPSFTETPDHLVCHDGHGKDDVVVFEVFSQGVLPQLSPSSLHFPDGGGTFDICLDHRDEVQCFVNGFTPGVGQTTSGVIDQFALCMSEDYASSLITVTDDAVFDVSCNSGGFREFVVTVGPTITSFTRTRNVFHVPGTFEMFSPETANRGTPEDLAWDSIEVTSCDLFENGVVVASGTAGAYTYPADVDATFALVCQGDDGSTQERDVAFTLAPSLSIVDASVSDGGLTVRLVANALDVQTCTATLSANGVVVASQQMEDPFFGQVQQIGADVPFDFEQNGAASVHVHCVSDFDGSDVDADGPTVDPPNPLRPRITSLTVTPSHFATGSAGGDVQVCLVEENVDTCTLTTSFDSSQTPMASGDCVTATVTGPSAFVVDCANATADVFAQTSVQFGPAVDSFTVTLDPGGTTATFAWSAFDVDTCSLFDESHGITIATGAATADTLDAPVASGFSFFELLCFVGTDTNPAASSFATVSAP